MGKAQFGTFLFWASSRLETIAIRLGWALLAASLLLTALPLSAQSSQITGVVKDPQRAVVAGAQVIVTNSTSKAKTTALTNDQGAYAVTSLSPGAYTVQVDAKGFKPAVSNELNLGPGQTVTSDFALILAGTSESVNVIAGSVENAYRVDTAKAGGPLGAIPILDLPYSVNVISRQLIDDTQSRNFKEAAKFLPLASYQEMQGPEVLRPESRGFQGSNMQNDRKDGMGFAVTTPSAMEEYEQIEVVNGLAAPLYGPANPSGIFNFVTKRPTDEPLHEVEMDYEGSTVGTAHADVSDRLGPNKMFGYRANVLVVDGGGYVSDSQLRRQLGAIALDVRPSTNTVIEGNFSYYNVFQHGYPGWFSYTPSLSASSNVLLPANAPDPTRVGYGQSFSGVDLNNQISEVRVKHNFGPNWQLMVGALNQLADRNINTAVNSFLTPGQTNTINGIAKIAGQPGQYATYLANSFSGLAPRFQVKSDLGYLTGTLKTGTISHNVVIGSTGYRFASWSANGSGPAKTALCTTATVASTVAAVQSLCTANISAPAVDLPPAAGLYSYAQTSPTNGIYVSSILHQQGFSLADTITLTPRWLVRVAASQDRYWTNNYANLGVPSVTPPAANISTQGVSPSASLMFKPRPDMTLYGTFSQSLQAPDTPIASTSTVVVANSNQALAPYRDKEGEIGYKVTMRKITFTGALFRIERPFTGLVQDTGACGSLTKTQTCYLNEFIGTQLNYGAEGMLSGQITQRLIVTGGLTALDPKLNNTGISATNGKVLVGIPHYKSNVLSEYRLPVSIPVFLHVNWEHVGSRAIDPMNTSYTPQYNLFDVGFRYTTKIMGKETNWRITANNITNVHYWSTIGMTDIVGNPGGGTLGNGQTVAPGSTQSYLGHLGEPRLITASMRFVF
jgi:iron complex outermembrane receptor protein